jgi:quercetin dioxygenase-like cupin family protein
MINIKGTEKFLDRWPLTITHIDTEHTETFPATEGTYYVLLKNSSYRSSRAEFREVDAAMAVNSEFTVSTGQGTACVIEFPGLHCLESRYYVQDQLDQGNLSYMDGGTNTTAINPGRLGDPVVNYVHFPPNMYQTLHTHPSHRVGLVLRGQGKIELDNNEFYPVREGEIFYMRRNELHNFITEDSAVILFVFAPDSGTGPTDEINPLKVRPYVGQQRYAR